VLVTVSVSVRGLVSVGEFVSVLGLSGGAQGEQAGTWVTF